MRHIAISGDIGSGKTSVAELLSRLLQRQVARAGEMQRSMASSFGLTTLQANKLAETKTGLDEEIDNRIIALGASENGLIFDSRMAWYLIPEAFKVHLIADPEVAARRLLKRFASAVESYTSLAEAMTAAEERYQSERSRFTTMHGVDISLLGNYDLVVDTSDAPPSMIVDEIDTAMTKDIGSRYHLRVSPRRVRRVDEWARLVPARMVGGVDLQPISSAPYPVVGYLRPAVIALHPNAALDNAVTLGQPLIPALLGAEGEGLASFDTNPKVCSYVT